jgi:hypothetical protein
MLLAIVVEPAANPNSGPNSERQRALRVVCGDSAHAESAGYCSEGGKNLGNILRLRDLIIVHKDYVVFLEFIESTITGRRCSSQRGLVDICDRDRPKHGGYLFGNGLLALLDQAYVIAVSTNASNGVTLLIDSLLESQRPPFRRLQVDLTSLLSRSLQAYS